MSEKQRILVVDDSLNTLEVLERNLSERFVVFTAKSVMEAVSFLESERADLVITDLKMPQVSGLDLVRHVNDNLRDTEVMMITGYATIDSAIEAVKMGAEEYLSKPFTNEELLAAVERALDKLHQRRVALCAPHTRYGLIGESTAMQAVYSSIEKATRSNATVLITGESGTGKELVARAIHYGSPRAQAAFVPVNCGGIPEGLLESELFGHMKGAFTGANETRAGFFQTADRGTIFLDEISETCLQMQVKLLRVLQEKEVLMVGGSRPRQVDVRIFAATNKDLLRLVERNLVREDLYSRINVLTVEVPPLRDREDDILLLANHFAAKLAEEQGKPVPTFTDQALTTLKKYSWPGNVRELENIVNRLLVMIDGDTIDVPDLPSLMRFSANKKSGVRSLAEVEGEHMKNVLASVNGNKTRAAELLGIDRKTLREKLKRHAIN